jgi:hypothetical protein
MLLLLQFFFWLFSLSRNACHFLPCTYLVVYLSIRVFAQTCMLRAFISYALAIYPPITPLPLTLPPTPSPNSTNAANALHAAYCYTCMCSLLFPNPTRPPYHLPLYPLHATLDPSVGLLMTKPSPSRLATPLLSVADRLTHFISRFLFICIQEFRRSLHTNAHIDYG